MMFVSNEALYNIDVTFVCGYLCSGKTTTAHSLHKAAEIGEAMIIEVSTIVKNILQTSDRSKLQGRPDIDVQIIEQLRKLIEQQVRKGVDYFIISGVRQLSILKAFPSAQYLWVSCDERVRFDRYHTRKEFKDVDRTHEGFVAANQRDIELGIDEVKQFIFNQPSVAL
ncbi:MAG: AAA family ATPase [Acinetobacter sp.]|nr:AAA family ATPase [Acinetobacter sp.]